MQPAPDSVALEHVEQAAPLAREPLAVELVASDEQLHAIATEWNSLVGEMPFLLWEWLECWWRHYQKSGDELFVITVRDTGGKLVGLLPTYLARSAAFGRVVKFLGSGRVCSDYLTLVAKPELRTEVTRAVARWLTAESPRAWQAIELACVSEGDPAIDLLADDLATRGCGLFVEPGQSCWRVELPGDWDSYLATLSKSRRERVRQLCRRQFDTGRARVEYVETLVQLRPALATLRDLHQRRRQSMGQSGSFTTREFQPFLEEATERLLHLGCLRMLVVHLEDQPVAVQCNMIAGSTLYHYQSGLDPARSAERPGWLGTIAALRQAFAEGCTAYDFLRGDESYKSHWRAEPQPMAHLRIVSTTASARLRHQLWLGKRSAKALVKKALRYGAARTPQTSPDPT